MNDHELDLALADFGATRAQETAPPVLRARIGAVSLPANSRRDWLPRFPKWGHRAMFSATKLVVAGVIVALFGGFLLAGILTTPRGDEVVPAAVSASPSPKIEQTTPSPAPMTTDEMLSGFTSEQVEPGVLRVVSDSQRDLLSENNRGVVAGQDGSIWLLRKNRFFRLGDAQGHQWHDDDREERSQYDNELAAVAPDGTVWAAAWSGQVEAAERLLGSYDGRDWRVHRPSKGLELWGLAVAADGTVWTRWSARGDDHGSLWALGPDGWRMLETPWNQWRITGDGELISWEWSLDEDYGVDVKRYIDGTWQDWRSARLESAPPGLGTTLGGSEVRAGPDGTVWAFLADQVRRDVYLMRLDDTGKREWGPTDSTPAMPIVPIAVAPDRSLWGVPRGSTCDGVSRFDGETWDRYLRDLCIHQMDIADDGSVWLLAGTAWDIVKTTKDGTKYGSPAPTDLYVITPEAIAAGESP